MSSHPRPRRDGATVAGVVQLTKTGQVFVFNRENGAPLFPIEERAVPPSDVNPPTLMTPISF